jgi:tankyrase
LAARHGHATFCRMLIQRGANTTIVNHNGELASDLGGSDCFQEIGPAGDAVSTTHQNSIILEAARSGDLETVMSLCTPQNVNCRDLEGRHSTPLHFAAGYNRHGFAYNLIPK